MIKPESLRIGNIFSIHSHEGYLGDFALKAESIVLAQNDIKAFNEGHCPYKLNEKWLIRLGFEKSQWNTESKFPCYKRGRLVIFDDKDEYDVRIEHKKGETVNIRHVKFVHELQNLHPHLTGEELVVSSPVLNGY